MVRRQALLREREGLVESRHGVLVAVLLEAYGAERVQRVDPVGMIGPETLFVDGQRMPVLLYRRLQPSALPPEEGAEIVMGEAHRGVIGSERFGSHVDRSPDVLLGLVVAPQHAQQIGPGQPRTRVVRMAGAQGLLHQRHGPARAIARFTITRARRRPGTSRPARAIATTSSSTASARVNCPSLFSSIP